MAKNVYFTQGTSAEQYLIEDLIIESISIYGQEVFYIPRTLVSKDEILGEDRLSEFKTSFPIDAYFENVDSFAGGGAFVSKFGMMLEQSATLVVPRRKWEQLVGRYGVTTIPTRPNEGDLIYFPLTKGLFEIKFVTHQDPFYQLGKLYVYKLQVELFQYASESIDTGNVDIDIFETLKTFSVDTDVNPYGRVKTITMTNQGSGYLTPPTVTIINANGIGATATAVLGTGASDDKVVSVTIDEAGTGYTDPTTITFTSVSGVNAAANVTILANIDDVDSFGDNNSFKEQSRTIINIGTNPLGIIDNE